MQIAGKVFIVTGGASGLGEGTARMLAEHGGKVVIADMQTDKGEAVAKEIGGVFVKCDVSQEADGQAAVAAALKLGKLVGLVNCAGIAPAEKTVGKNGPHALAVFDRTGVRPGDQAARKVVRWLRRMRAPQISREDVRREALCQSVDAWGAEEVLARLEAGGVLRPLMATGSSKGGPRRRRWEVNPAVSAVSATPLPPSLLGARHSSGASSRLNSL